jgi:hypothetical protein
MFWWMLLLDGVGSPSAYPVHMVRSQRCVNKAEPVKGILWAVMFSVTGFKFCMKKVTLGIDNCGLIAMLHICS